MFSSQTRYHYNVLPTITEEEQDRSHAQVFLPCLPAEPVCKENEFEGIVCRITTHHAGVKGTNVVPLFGGIRLLLIAPLIILCLVFVLSEDGF